MHVSVDDTPILKGIDLHVPKGEVHALMGPNGSGKSTLANTLMGHPAYEVTGGRVTFKGQDILELATDERARLGMFMAFQYPSEITGVRVANFLRMALNAQREDEISAMEFRRLMMEKMRLLRMDAKFASRYLNEGFSAARRSATRSCSWRCCSPSWPSWMKPTRVSTSTPCASWPTGWNTLRSAAMATLVITHYQRLLAYIVPDVVHVLIDGRIARTGGKELALELDEVGYEAMTTAQEA